MDEKRANWAKSTTGAITICVLEGCNVLQYPDQRVEFIADADIDMDGANGQVDAKLVGYTPDNKGLEDLRNACYPKSPHNYRDILVCDLDDIPIKQGKADPAPGAFISMTAYENPKLKRTDPRKYIDAATVNYIVISSVIRRLCKGIALGAAAKVTHTKTGKSILAMVADIGPAKKIGELSYAAAKELGIAYDPRKGGEEDRVIQYQFFAGKPAELNGVKYNLIKAGA